MGLGTPVIRSEAGRAFARVFVVLVLCSCAEVPPEPPECLEDILTDPNHCGVCDNACRPGQECREGVCTDVPICEPECLDYEVCCEDRCIGPVELLGSEEHCGACGNACSDSEQCVYGECQFRDPACPCGPDSVCCPVGESFVCLEDLELGSSDRHCGACNQVCSPGECTGGQCMCPSGQLRCSNESGTVVCTETFADDDHCGRCGNRCAEGEACYDGQCFPSTGEMCAASCDLCCDDPAAPGTGVCVDRNEVSNTTHCGGCFQTCQDAEQCIRRESGYECGCRERPPESTLCGDTCANLETSTEHCGACGNACTDPGAACVDGSCVPGDSDLCDPACADGLVCCDGASGPSCVSPTFESEEHCGACGIACRPGEQCRGVCMCVFGHLCDDVCIRADENNCAFCGDVCDPGQRCANRGDEYFCG